MTIKFNKATPCNQPKEYVYSIAEDAAQSLGYRPNSELADIVTRLGGTFGQKDFWNIPGSDAGSIEIRGENDFTIFVSDEIGVERDRFTVAHELGHYILHYVWHKQFRNVDPGPTMAMRYGSDPAEWEANWFAAAFLMPEKEFLTSLKRATVNGRVNYNKLAAQFGVSASAARIRAESLSS